MQYDENAEKYGYEGEMTPIECDKLKPYTYDDMIDGDADTDIEYYSKSDADAIIAQKDFEIDRLKEFNAFLKHRISNGDVGCSIFLDDLEQKDKEIAELKKKLEDAKATHYAEMVDAGMRERRLRRALWLKRADDAKHLVTAYENYDYLDCQKMTIKQETARTWMTCKLRTAEEWVKVWKNIERKCRAMAERYGEGK